MDNVYGLTKILAIIEVVQNSECPEELAMDGLEKIRQCVIDILRQRRSNPGKPAVDPMVICAWCDEIMHQGDGDRKHASHGICERCMRRLGYIGEGEELPKEAGHGAR
jgi:hypothetical protein